MISESTLTELLRQVKALEERIARTEVIETGREKLTAARTYYVRTNGSDSNNGLADTAAGAFLTVQKAIDVISDKLDFGIYDVTIQLAAGTYSTSLGNTCKQCIGAGKVIILGDETTPANVVITTTGASPMNIASQGINTIYSVRGVRFTSTGSGNQIAISAYRNAVLEYQNVDFGSGFLSQTRANEGAVIIATGNYLISAGAGRHHLIDDRSGLNVILRTITLTGTPNFTTAFVYCRKISLSLLQLNTYTGAATGVRYNVDTNSIIDTLGGGATYLPGDAAGVTATGGLYV